MHNTHHKLASVLNIPGTKQKLEFLKETEEEIFFLRRRNGDSNVFSIPPVLDRRGNLRVSITFEILESIRLHNNHTHFDLFVKSFMQFWTGALPHEMDNNAV